MTEVIDSDLVLSPGGFYDVEGVEEIEDVENELSVTLPSAEGMTTIGGFMMEQLGRMPRPGDSVTIENLVFRILEMTGPRVKKVRIRRNAALAPSNSPESATQARPVSQSVKCINERCSGMRILKMLCGASF